MSRAVQDVMARCAAACRENGRAPPDPPDLSRCHTYGALTLVSYVYRLISLAGPGPSGSAKPARLCQRRFPPRWQEPWMRFPARTGQRRRWVLPSLSRLARCFAQGH